MYSLHAESESYRGGIDQYVRFAAAEDAPQLVYRCLLPYVQGRDVLDCGCGSGKYLRLFVPHARCIVGVDRASGCIERSTELAAQYPTVKVYSSCASNLPVATASIDCVYATWVISTILDPTLRDRVIQECRRVLRPGGHILLAENAQCSEFEIMRGRDAMDSRTRLYNETVTNRYGFDLIHTVNSWIQFSSPTALRETIGAIWGPAALGRLPLHAIETSRISHTVHIFRTAKK
jgi:ubiquinone/menaquinone biosynthesis C-methylase UbiE